MQHEQFDIELASLTDNELSAAKYELRRTIERNRAAGLPTIHAAASLARLVVETNRRRSEREQRG